MCNVSLAQPPSWLVVPSGFSVLRTDQGGWTITPKPLPLPLLPSVAEDSIVNAKLGTSRVPQCDQGSTEPHSHVEEKGSTGVSNARDAAIAPALPSPHSTALPEAWGAANAPALPSILVDISSLQPCDQVHRRVERTDSHSKLEIM